MNGDGDDGDDDDERQHTQHTAPLAPPAPPAPQPEVLLAARPLGPAQHSPRAHCPKCIHTTCRWKDTRDKKNKIKQ